MTLVKENEELLPHHTIVLETEWEIGTYYRLDFPQKHQTEVIMTFFIGVDLHKTQFTVHVRTEEKVESSELNPQGTQGSSRIRLRKQALK